MPLNEPGTAFGSSRSGGTKNASQGLLGQATGGYNGAQAATAGPMGPPSQLGSYGGTSPYGYGGSQLAQNWQMYAGLGAPQIAQLQNQQALLGLQLGTQGQQYANQQQQLQDSYGYDTARLGLEQQGIGIDQAAAQRQQSYYDQLFGVDREKYQQAMGYTGDLKGFSREDFQNTLNRLANQATQTRYTADSNVKDLQSDLAAAGSFTSAGGRRKRGDIYANRDFQLTDLARQVQGTDIGFRRDQAGFDNTMANLTSDFKAAGLTNQEQQARLGDRLQQLDLQAQGLGISRQELDSRLQTGLTTLNLNNTVSVGQLMDAMSSNNAQQQQWANSIVMQALGVSGGG